MWTNIQPSNRSVICAGILSDTHLRTPDSHFLQRVRTCFDACDVIIHAGDMTGCAVVDAFVGKTVHAVCGNMCDSTVRARFPEYTQFSLGRFTLGLAHGAHQGPDIEQSLWNIFPEADCIIYGHTHRPVCHRLGPTLFLNPGTFQATGPYGAPGTYAILVAGEQLSARILEVPQFP